jgi:hypothetical protein
MTPAAALLDRLLDIVVTTELDLPPSGMTSCDPLMDVTRARDGWIWTCRHMRHHIALELR